jgi:hypothetical protein
MLLLATTFVSFDRFRKPHKRWPLGERGGENSCAGCLGQHFELKSRHDPSRKRMWAG